MKTLYLFTSLFLFYCISTCSLNLSGNNKQFFEDTLKIEGNSIIILRPDSIRYNEYIEDGEDWIYEVDSDFGFGISGALDTFNNFEVKEYITTIRFIEVTNCFDCPLIFDRDSIDYGFILTSLSNKHYVQSNQVYGYDCYLDKFQSYFE